MNDTIVYAINDLEAGAKDISFYYKELTDAELSPFFQKLESNQTLETLDLDDNLITSCTDITTFLKNNTTLTELTVNNNMFGESGSIEIITAIQHHPSLKTLELDNNTWTDCTDINIESIVPALVQNTTLTRLSLSECRLFLFSNGIDSFSKVIEQNKTLVHIELNNNKIGNRGAIRLAEALQKNTSLESLSLWHNKIGDDGVSAIAKMLFTNSTLLDLELGANHIKRNGCKALAHALRDVNDKGSQNPLSFTYESDRRSLRDKSDNVPLSDLYESDTLCVSLRYNSSLTRLGLDQNKISCEGAIELANMLQKNTTLLTLDIGDNDIKTKGIQALAHALCINTTLTDMDMNSCESENQGIQSIIQVMRQNQTLKSLDIWGIHMDSKEIEMLTDALSTNYSMTCIGKVLPIPYLERNQRLFNMTMGWKTKMNCIWASVIKTDVTCCLGIFSEYLQIKNLFLRIKKQKEINKNEK